MTPKIPLWLPIVLIIAPAINLILAFGIKSLLLEPLLKYILSETTQLKVISWVVSIIILLLVHLACYLPGYLHFNSLVQEKGQTFINQTTHETGFYLILEYTNIEPQSSAHDYLLQYHLNHYLKPEIITNRDELFQFIEMGTMPYMHYKVVCENESCHLVGTAVEQLQAKYQVIVSTNNEKKLLYNIIQQTVTIQNRQTQTTIGQASNIFFSLGNLQSVLLAGFIAKILSNDTITPFFEAKNNDSQQIVLPSGQHVDVGVDNLVDLVLRH